MVHVRRQPGTLRSRDLRSGDLVLTDRCFPVELVELRPALAVRVLARLRGPSLDEELAAGCSPDDDPLRAVRARWLVRPAVRAKLARDWERLVERAKLPPTLLGSRLAVCRSRVLDAAPDIRLLAASLRTPQPVPARGVAMAAALLADGSSPIYERRSRDDLGARLREVRARLDPSTRLLEEDAA